MINNELLLEMSGDDLPNRGRLLGIDFGTVRIGLSISDPNQSIASPLMVYQRRNSKLDAIFFQQLIQEEQIVGLVLGMPIHLSGQPSQKSVEATAFGEWLKSLTQRPLAGVDERFSTSIARDYLRESHLSGKKKKAQLDKLAAQVILSVYLDARSSVAAAN